MRQSIVVRCMVVYQTSLSPVHHRQSAATLWEMPVCYHRSITIGYSNVERGHNLGTTDLAQKRQGLLESLSAERANLFYQMRGLTEALLCTGINGSNLSMRDRLPELGYGDALTASNISHVMRDDRAAVRLESPADRPSILAIRGVDPPLPEALAIALKERIGFLNALNQVPDDMLFRRLSLPNKRRATMATWVRARARQDGIQAQELARWRPAVLAESADGRPPPTRLILRPLLQASRQEFMVLATRIPPAERESRPVCGHWTLKDVFGHISVYEHIGTTMMRQLVEGEPPTFEQTIRDFDRFNESQVVSRQPVAWKEIADAYRIVRKVNLSLLESLSDEALAVPFVAPWGSPMTGYDYIIGLAAHEREHAAMLRSSLGLQPLPKRSRYPAT